MREFEGKVAGKKASIRASVTVDFRSGSCKNYSFIVTTIRYAEDGSRKNAFLSLKKLHGHHDAHATRTAGEKSVLGS